MVNEGLFITLEGGEGAGKSTVIQALKSYFEGRGCVVVTTFEPGDTALGKEIRNLVLASEGTVDPLAELLLFLADRAQHVENTILPALQKGQVVLCDRFSDSTIAYQGFGRGLDVPTVDELCQIAAKDLTPRLTLFLTVSPEVGLERARATLKKESNDRIETETLAFHERLHQGFHWLAEQHEDRIVVIDAEQPLEQVIKEAVDAVSALR